MKSYITILIAVLFVGCFALSCFAACPSMDFTGDCRVNFKDFAKFAEQWLDEGISEPNGVVWVSINEPNFTGYMSKYETTNAQYCQFLNAALASGDITISGDYVDGASGSNGGTDFVGQVYYNLSGVGTTGYGATNGGAARINYTGGTFIVDPNFENHPVTYVSWYGATAFCNYYGYRLPTEWEWQAVADYDGSYIYGCGTSINNSKANYISSTHPDGTTVVGSFGTYGYGMCDMAGNVWEWTNSCYYYPGCDYGHLAGRGGRWYDDPWNCVVDARVELDSEWGADCIGFRACR